MVPNTDERSKQIYADWFERYKGTDRVTGSRTADMRSALVDYFREQGRILIATEAAPRAPAVLLAGGKLRPALESAAH